MKGLAKLLAVLALAAGVVVLFAAWSSAREEREDYIVLERYGNT